MTPATHETCRHRFYGMSCEQYEALVEEARNCCQVCGLRAIENPLRKLFIDHDYRHGYWAVRGLLCNPCNTVIGIDGDTARTPEMAAYLGNPWYARMLAERGLVADLPEEPPIGSVVVPKAKTASRLRAREGWIVEGRPHMGVKSWRKLHRLWGPHNMTVTTK